MVWNCIGAAAIAVTVVISAGMCDEEDPGQGRVVATVNGVSILKEQVDCLVRLAERRAKLANAEDMRRETLNQLINRQLVMAWLQRNGHASSKSDVALEIGRLQSQLSRQEKTLQDHLKTLGLSEPSFRETIAWRTSWKRYLEEQLTDTNLKKYFEKHRARYDGTKVRVAQILLSTSGGDHVAAVIQRASRIRQDIADGSISFSDAAKKFSEAPSAKIGGDIGWISQEGPMPKRFTDVAFALLVGEVGEPLTSPSGVHLIKCLEIEPGTRTWQQSRGLLKSGTARYLFEWIAGKERPRAVIRMVQPGTQSTKPVQ